MTSQFDELLDDVALGETIVITRQGEPIARLVPDNTRRQAEIDQAIDEIKKHRRRGSGVTVDDILSARHEGHKY